MALREILVWPDPRLKQVAQPVGQVDDAVRKLCDDMAETMYEARGVGLAAPQIGVLQRVICVDTEQRDEAKKPGEGLFWLIDPVLKLGEGEFTYQEGCLSIPDEYEDVTRYDRIVVEYTGRDGKRTQREAQGTLLSVCIQHEMDHLEGKLFVDYLSTLKRELIKRRMKKLKAGREAEKKGQAAAL